MQKQGMLTPNTIVVTTVHDCQVCNSYTYTFFVCSAALYNLNSHVFLSWLFRFLTRSLKSSSKSMMWVSISL